MSTSGKKALSRRRALQVLAATPLTAVRPPGSAGLRNNIRHSVCRWCYRGLSIDELAAAAARLGLQSVELIGPEEFAVVKTYGLTCGMAKGTGPIENCLNRVANHDRCERELKQAVDFASAEKIPSVICFSGNRDGMPDEEGLENCAAGIKRVMSHAEKMGVNVVLELLNSKVTHIDYMGDKMSWGVRLVNRVGSPRFKLLYDIFHMQIMEGDVIRTIREHKDYIVHYHTGGVPGRHEIDDSQELNYPAIVRAILETGYEGFLGQEFVPTRDPLTSLEQGVRICDV